MADSTGDFEDLLKGHDGGAGAQDRSSAEEGTGPGAEEGTGPGVGEAGPDVGGQGTEESGTAAAGIRLPDDEDLDDHARYDRATFAFETRNYGRAADLLEPLAQAEPGNSAVQLLLARSYYHAARLGPAEQVSRDILKRWPSEAYAHLLLARTLQRAGRAEEGARHLKIAEAMGLDA